MLFQSMSVEAVQRVAERYGAALREEAGGQIEVLGPVEAPLGRIKGYYRWYLLLRGGASKALRSLAAEVDRRERGEARKHKGIVTIDVDPVGML